MSLKNYIQDHKNELEDKKMSKDADLKFEKMLKTEMHRPKKQKVFNMRILAYAASVALLILGAVYVNDISVSQQKTVLVENLADNSAGTRLESVYKFNDEYEKEDQQIIAVLIDILHNDSNVNVKIATIDVLLKYPENNTIRENILLALEKEKEPMVQIKLIKSISVLRETRAQIHLENLIENNETLPIVKNNAQLAMSTIKQ